MEGLEPVFDVSDCSRLHAMGEPRWRAHERVSFDQPVVHWQTANVTLQKGGNHSDGMRQQLPKHS